MEETRRGPLAHDLGHEEGGTQENESDCQFPSGMAPSINHRKPALGEERRAGMEGEDEDRASGGGNNLTLCILVAECILTLVHMSHHQNELDPRSEGLLVDNSCQIKNQVERMGKVVTCPVQLSSHLCSRQKPGHVS